MLRTLRSKVLAILSLLMLVSLAGVGVSFWFTQQVNSKLEEINRRSVPMQRELVQLASDSELLRREMDRSLGFSNWKDPRWKPRRIPLWALEVHRTTLDRLKKDFLSAPSWQDWYSRLLKINEKLSLNAETLFLRLQEHNFDGAAEIYPEWINLIEMLQKEVEWAKREMDRETRKSFQLAREDVKDLRLALQLLLIVVIGVSFLILWMGERALRPIGHLRKIVQQITERGNLTAHDKAHLPNFSVRHNDEVSDLAREFHQMATSLLEREKTVQFQKERLEDQNKQLLQMGALNQNILKSIPSLLLVCDREGLITHCNQKMLEVLNVGHIDSVIGRSVTHFPWLNSYFENDDDQTTVKKINSTQNSNYSGSLFPLWPLLPLKIDANRPSGRILLLDDMSESLGLQKRLQQAEHLAAVGRMSAQVAHEVGNPLHSIGLEAELALEVASKVGIQGEIRTSGVISVKQSLQTILKSVERLQKIIQNYLRLSKLTPDHQTLVDVNSIIEAVLATYANSCENHAIKVNWKFEKSVKIKADADLLEYALGNLMRNSIQALESLPKGQGRIGIEARSLTENQLQIIFSDNGPGISSEVQDNLFKPFFTTKAQGTGLGLSFVKKVFEDLGGEFILASTQTGVGAIFIGTLPMSSTPVLAQKPEGISL